jgi:hypothetical protein
VDDVGEQEFRRERGQGVDEDDDGSRIRDDQVRGFEDEEGQNRICEAWVRRSGLAPACYQGD